jgi:hypothetical protein
VTAFQLAAVERVFLAVKGVEACFSSGVLRKPRFLLYCSGRVVLILIISSHPCKKVDNSTLITEGDINKLKKWPIPKLLN